MRRGKLTSDEYELKDTLCALDRLNCLALDYHKYFELADIPMEFIKILQEEEWLRNKFYSVNNEHSILILDSTTYERLSLMNHTIWKYVTDILIETPRDISHKPMLNTIYTHNIDTCNYREGMPDNLEVYNCDLNYMIEYCASVNQGRQGLIIDMIN